MGNDRKEVVNTFVLILQIGLTMLIPIVACTLIGAKLDAYFSVKYVGVIGFVLGSIAGFQNVYRLVKRYLSDTKSPGQIKREQDEKAKSK